ncbi:protein-arginine deiminase family protein [Humisphaera borealis]|uniref:Protein-arginine deiminase C-terminal domain-containing protein n=1 Tax=Humisphaera borealis TaxID=2807512 RepID=A0A7M2WXT2_9BACT|nr:protein-arginine deiminase family protein [Humisphaera borealis]QOV90295.1 hypothetical protein IPV69_02675 [Humisphaera borealis]
MQIQTLEARTLFSALFPQTDIRVDSNRDGVITVADNTKEETWTSGKLGAGAVILPNFDRDNTTSLAPDNWAGGNWNGRPAAPNNIIDNTADLADVGRFRLYRLGSDFESYQYKVTLQIIGPATDSAFHKGILPQDRVRVFFPSKQTADGNLTVQPGDVAVFGPGLGDTIRFVNNPAALNEYAMSDLGGDGYLEFGIEGLRAGAQVRLKLTIEYDPILTDIVVAGEPAEPPTVMTDTAVLRVAPFVLSDNRMKVKKAIVENMNRYGFDNAELRNTMSQVFGSRKVESRSGDIWQQDGYEIGYVAAPYGSMSAVLDLPRATDVFFEQGVTMRSFVRGTLLGSGVGVATDVAGFPHVTSSAFGGDIEGIGKAGGKPGQPGYMLASGMPQFLKDFIAAQGTHQVIDLKLDDWLSVAHVDEVIHYAADGKHVAVADPESAWALLLWAAKLNPNVKMHPTLNGNEWLPNADPAGVKASVYLNNPILRQQNMEYAMAASRLPAAWNAIKSALKLTEELTTPAAAGANTGTARLVRGGAFTQFLSGVKRTFQIKFTDADRYRLRYSDNGGTTWSGWADGQRSKDCVFPEAKAFLLKHYWTGVSKAGDVFTYATNPAATLIKMPVLFYGPDAFFQGAPIGQSVVIEGPPRLGAFTMNHVNSLVDGGTVITGKAQGPKVAWRGGTASDILEDYAAAVFRGAGYTTVRFADAAIYHNSGGSIHCGTNAIREIPTEKWWA